MTADKQTRRQADQETGRGNVAPAIGDVPRTVNDSLAQLVEEVREVTGAQTPELLAGDAPVLDSASLSGDGEGFYLVGLIGGKDVGKSALVNALVGQQITAQTSHGPGTEIAVAYVHAAQEPAVRQLLDREVPGRFRILTHSIPRLYRQVLLDLPDIDSHFEDHVELTRRMLRHMLFPIWIQSIEKYADRQPQELLARVATGNAPENFIFCLNKLDQLVSREGPAAAKELRDDFAQRLARTLKLPESPRVYAISAIAPDQFDLPRLRDLLGQQKTGQAVVASKQRAVRQQTSSIISWLNEQNLPLRAQRLDRLYEDAEALVTDRIAAPLLEQSIPQLLEDPTLRGALAEEAMRRRVSHWPLVNIIHALLSPLFSVVRQAVGWRVAAAPGNTDAFLDAYLQLGGRGVPSLVQTTFAQLNQSHPALANLYRSRKLWESQGAASAASDLRQALARALQRQRDIVLDRLGNGGGAMSGVIRFLLTIGALLWFPIVQPLLEAALQAGGTTPDLRALMLRVVQIMGVSYLLQNVSFLLIYFAILWGALRWDTQRRVNRLLLRWRDADNPDPLLNLSTQTLTWSQALLDEIRSAREHLDHLLRRVEQLRQSLAPAA